MFLTCARILRVHTHCMGVCVLTCVCVCIQTFPAWLVCQGCPGWLVVGDKAVAYELAQLLFVSTACFTVNFDYAASLTECVYSLVSQ